MHTACSIMIVMARLPFLLAAGHKVIFIEGELLNASFNCPTSIVKKHSGFYYVADSGNHVIRVLDVYGVVESQHSCPLSFSTPILYTQTGYDR